jgi:diguanylate cyclase (GGDEF)-like protein
MFHTFVWLQQITKQFQQKMPSGQIGTASPVIRKTLLNLGLRVAIVIIISAICSYLFVFGQAQQQVQEQLHKYVVERGKRESEVFQLANDRHQILRNALLDPAFRDTLKPVHRFPLYPWQDGSQRNFPQHRPLSEFDSEHLASIFLGQHQPLTLALRQKLTRFEQLVLQYGLAWRDRATNTYLIAPENAAVVYWPEVPGPLMVPGDFDVHNEVFFYLSDRSHDPQRKTVWTDVYHDPASPDWIISVVTPVDDAAGNHIATIGHDIVLTDLIQRSLSDRLMGTYNIIFSPDGHLIVHPDFGTQINAKNGQLTIQDLNQPHLNRIFQEVGAMFTSDIPTGSVRTGVINNRVDGEFLAVTQLTGPNWYFVTVYPQTLLHPTAITAAKFILASGLTSLLIEVMLMYGVLRKQVATPLQELQQLSLVDGLTQVGNRRQLDTYLTQEWKRLQRQKSESLSLILCDVDYFKLYNDHYGHPSGDACLQQVAQVLRQTVKRPGDLVARYGGEEFMIVLPTTDEAGAIAIATAIQEAIQHLQLSHSVSPINHYVTMSMGISTLQPNLDIPWENLVKQADQALYLAKQQGRNRVCSIAKEKATLLSTNVEDRFSQPQRNQPG